MKLAYIDLEQAESRAVGAITYRLFDDSAYLDACESGDLHSLVCAMCWTTLDWPEDFNIAAIKKYGKLPPELLKEGKRIAKQNAYRNMSYRDLAKRLGHGSNYYGKPPQMAKHTHVEVQIIRDFQRAYFDTFPGIPRWHRWVAQQLQLHHQLTTFLGRRRFFFGRSTDDSTLREAIAYEPQSVATGDYMNFGLYNLWEANLPIHIFAQVHDAVAFSYDERDEHWIIPKTCALLETSFPIHSPTKEERIFSIPTEALVGWNLSYRTDENPDGLIVWSNNDERKRTKQNKSKISDFILA